MRRRAPTILRYHRVVDEAACDPSGLCVTPERFRAHLDALVDARRPILPLDELARLHEAGAAPRGALAITFDVGYRDVLTTAAPLLASHGVPGTVFVISGALGASSTWWDRLAAAVLLGERSDDVDIVVEGRTRTVPMADRESAHRALWHLLLVATDDEREAALAALGEPTPVVAPILTDDDLAILERTGPIRVGSHTANHLSMTRIDHRRRACEIEKARVRLEELVGHPVDGIAYPHGNADRDVAAAARRAGHRWGVITGNRCVAKTDDVLRLPRQAVLDWGADDFRRRLDAWGC